MSAPGNVIEDDENESAKTILADAIEEGGDRQVGTEDVAELARELAAAKADRKALLESNATSAKAHQETRTALQTETERRFAAAEEAVANGLVAAQSELDRLTKDAARAFEEGNWELGAKLSAEAGEQRINLRGYEQGKERLTAERERAKQQVSRDPKDNLPPRSRAWVEAHPRFESDEVFQGWALTADREARRLGIQPETDAYFAHIERRISENEASMSGTGTQPKSIETPAERAAAEVETPAPRNAATVAAPVSRRAAPANGNGSKSGTIKLSQDERDTANRLFADRFPTEAERLQHYASMKTKAAERYTSQGA